MANESLPKSRRAHKRRDLPLTAQRLRQLVHYDIESGQFTRLKRWGARPIGEVLGSVGVRGYVVLSADGKTYPAHRLAWLYMTGEWPPEGLEIDHRNQKRTDNRWENLRLATHAQNLTNVALHRHNTSGQRGVCMWRGYWRAYTKIGGKQISLGYFRTKDEAIAAYLAAAPNLHGEFWTPQA